MYTHTICSHFGSSLAQAFTTLNDNGKNLVDRSDMSHSLILAFTLLFLARFGSGTLDVTQSSVVLRTELLSTEWRNFSYSYFWIDGGFESKLYREPSFRTQEIVKVSKTMLRSLPSLEDPPLTLVQKTIPLPPLFFLPPW